MLRYLGIRFLSLFVTLIVASIIVFTVMEIVPGDPAALMLGINARPDTLAALRAELGLDEPVLARYLDWVSGMARGDFGMSLTYRVPVSELIADRIAVSLPLTAYALVLAIFVGFSAGIGAAAARGGPLDWGIIGATQLGIAIPNFWFAMMLVFLFAISLGWFGAGGFPGWSDPVAAFRALTLPALALALPQAAILARVLRTSLIETLDEDYIRTARAKGVSQAGTLWRHALRNALIPVLTIIGLQVSFLLAGAIIIEQVFVLPGLGRLILQGITQRDLIVVQSTVMILVFALIVITFLVDIAYAVIDPRLRR
ncbi:MAG: ABC transporter permease [Rubricella sp.]